MTRVARPALLAFCLASTVVRPLSIASAAAVEPSIGADQTWCSFSNATTSPRGDTAGRSPSPSSFGSPPANGADQTETLAGSVAAAGFTGRLSSQFAPWSPPRT